MKLKHLGAFCLCFLALWLTGCFGIGGGGKHTAKNVECSFDELRVGDSVTITWADLPPPMWPEQKVRVKDDGTLSLPMNQTITVIGKKIAAIEKEIRALYVPKFFQQMTVTLKTEDRWYSVGGEVRTPSRQIYLGPTTVLRAIQSCGDFTDFANRRKVELIRYTGERMIVDCVKARKDPKFDVNICPGDAIHVPRRLM